MTDIIEQIAIIFATSTPYQDYQNGEWRSDGVREEYMRRAREAAPLTQHERGDEGKATAALAYLIEQIEYVDSYGVEGSSFKACLLCKGGGAPGVVFEHDADCPIMRCVETANEWWGERYGCEDDPAAPVADRDDEAKKLLIEFQGMWSEPPLDSQQFEMLQSMIANALSKIAREALEKDLRKRRVVIPRADGGGK